MPPHDAEVLTGLDGDGEPSSIIVRFDPLSDSGEMVVFDTAGEASEWADGVEQEARQRGVQDPALYSALEDIRSRAEVLE